MKREEVKERMEEVGEQGEEGETAVRMLIYERVS